MLQMILKSFRILLSLVILFLIPPVFGEDKIDIWSNKKKQEISSSEQKTLDKEEQKQVLQKDTNLNSNSLIQEETLNKSIESKVYGIYDPANFNLNLNMWSSTKSEDIKSSLQRIKKINLSTTSNEILENILLSFSYPPEGMSEKEFVDMKIDWLIDNQKTELIEKFLKQNSEFEGKKRAIQFLVDESISSANIKEGCEKIGFIDSTIKDPYLEKFKIYCLVFNSKKNEAQLLLDLLREQGKSDKYFDDKINFLLEISEKTTQKINEKKFIKFLFI